MRLEGATPVLTCDGLDDCIWRGWVAEVSRDRVKCDLILRVDVNDRL